MQESENSKKSADKNDHHNTANGNSVDCFMCVLSRQNKA